MIKYFIIYISLALYLVSCASNKQVAYFDNIQSGTIPAPTSNVDVPIQKNDILSISITSLNQEASAIFNVNNNQPRESLGYLVNEDGYVQLPILGNIRAIGFTKKQLSEHLTKLLIDKKLLVDPIVNIRHLNFKVTVLGEVARPTVVNVPSEKISLLEAIGLAGDLTIYGKRENVLLIREKQNGQKEIFRINLNNDQIFKSDFYYLQPNDVIYVEPNQAKVSSASTTRQWLPIVFSALSVILNVVRISTR
ncbi:MAG: polysaccharide biosynthesis/export family protein [Bacteroidota bacterium]|nr:polysaccharide biosynthesis/export family protein [Bacteroidota bacterium]